MRKILFEIPRCMIWKFMENNTIYGEEDIVRKIIIEVPKKLCYKMKDKRTVITCSQRDIVDCKIFKEVLKQKIVAGVIYEMYPCDECKKATIK